MPDTITGGTDSNNIFLYALLSIALLTFLAAYYFIRKSLQPKEYFDNKILSEITREEKEEYLIYCISFFQDAYDSGELPHISIFMELRISVSIVFTYYKNVKRAACVYMKLKKYYFKNKTLPDLTYKYKNMLRENGRSENDIVSAFCLYGVEEFSKIFEQADI